MHVALGRMHLLVIMTPRPQEAQPADRRAIHREAAERTHRRALLHRAAQADRMRWEATALLDGGRR